MSKKNKLDPRIVRTRRLLREALLDLLGEKNYETISVQDITDRATLNRATFYLHYKDKDDFLIKYENEMLSELFPENSAGNDIGTENIDFEHLVSIFEHIAEHSEFFYAMLLRKTIPGFINLMRKFIMNFYYDKLFTDDPTNNQLTIPRDINLSYIASAYIGVIIWWLENDMPYTPRFMATQLEKLTTLGPINA